MLMAPFQHVAGRLDIDDKADAAEVKRTLKGMPFEEVVARLVDLPFAFSGVAGPMSLLFTPGGPGVI